MQDSKDSLLHDGDHGETLDRKSTRLNSSHSQISYAVFCLKKKKYKLTIFAVPFIPHRPLAVWLYRVRPTTVAASHAAAVAFHSLALSWYSTHATADHTLIA